MAHNVKKQDKKEVNQANLGAQRLFINHERHQKGFDPKGELDSTVIRRSWRLSILTMYIKRIRHIGSCQSQMG